MSEQRFEWDGTKAKTNLAKHGVSFAEARTAFYDEIAIQFFGPDHSKEENCFILLEMNAEPQIRVVCHCVRECDTVVRIISARKADNDDELDCWRQRS